ncbi:hypothetical protein KZX37_06805 [Microbacterium sp. EYE_5]|uniref:DMP19 family protein n=1 Tax=unclassified Microbacterium TaxID=2609290 RepID=UPI002003CB0C|nr:MULTISPECIES: hypothetical protein [unclassified Microbacterium]MCK6080327.1 hypothetical protein [Microbacterium sp. EYE_382]MCK6085598.1 hypothetical protein [Microbacterium sp. EYE_384]MCK6122177.1 hypothetical protein [Microbacterium sp. EYE_80]MCK6126361.1 hypothetical protein [Microbacterium sp. EYE_79]MCK6141282.1 hypothetical protein [Microbacterium sp. EYE_39]
MSAASDEIWNRALEDDAPTTVGDAAVRRVVTFHGAVTDAGLWSAIETHADDDEAPLEAIADAFRTLGLEATAETIERASAEHEQTAGIGDDDAWSDAQERVDDEYIVEDDDITAAIERTLAQEPELFAPTG